MMVTTSPSGQKILISTQDASVKHHIDATIADVSRQVRILDADLGTGIVFDPDWIARTIRAGHCPDWVQKFYAQPYYKLIAPTYIEALGRILFLLGQKRGCELTLNDKPGHTVDFHFNKFPMLKWKHLKQAQGKCNYFVLPAQLGERHQGRSPCQAMQNYARNEMGLDVLSVAIILLANPDVLSTTGDVWIDCPGVWLTQTGGLVCYEPSFTLRNGKLELEPYWSSLASPDSGSATGFVP